MKLDAEDEREPGADFTAHVVRRDELKVGGVGLYDAHQTWNLVVVAQCERHIDRLASLEILEVELTRERLKHRLVHVHRCELCKASKQLC